MIKEQYHALLHSLCAVAGLDPQKLIEDGLLTVDGTDMLLFFDEKSNAGLLQVRMDFGKCVPESEARVMRGLMMANHTWGHGSGFAFSMHPKLENIILTFSMPVTPYMTGQMLADDLCRAAQEARQCWDAIHRMLRDPKNDLAMMGMMGI
jgi:hypothetical protein